MPLVWANGILTKVDANLSIPTASIDAPQSPKVISSGTWSKKEHRTKGTWSLVTAKKGYKIQLDSEFSTRKAPDLKLFLSPLPAEILNGKNSIDGSLLISPIKKNRGSQTFDVPAGVDLADYQTIVLVCEAYAKLWSLAPLQL